MAGTDLGDLYAAAKADLNSISTPLFEMAVSLVDKRGTFLPFGAVLDAAGQTQLHAATGEHEITNSVEVLPRLHEGLRASLQPDSRAVAVCEWVKITPPGSKQTDAIKVLVEHSNGLVMALYLPMRKKLLGRWETGELIGNPAKPEVRV